MKNYAMITNGQIIDVLYDQEEKPEWPPTNSGFPVEAIECSEEVTVDWNYNPETGEIYKTNLSTFKKIENKNNQLDRIEEALNKTCDELRLEGSNQAILELIRNNVI